MATHGVRVAFNALAASNRGLLTAEAQDIHRYKMSWAPLGTSCTLAAPETKGVWTSADGSPVRFVVLGVVDASRSRLGPYGTLMEADRPPTSKELETARFSVDITYPYIPAGHLDEDIEAGLINQLYCLDDIKESACAQLRAQGHPPPTKVTNWVNFRHSGRETAGSMRVYLGSVYEKAAGPTGIPDIEEDPNMFHGYYAGFSSHGLRHNSLLPCYTAAGAPIGRTGSALQHELYHGRWVKVELEMKMWNIKQENRLIFQLNATPLDTINAPAASVPGSWPGSSGGAPGAPY